MGSGPTPTSKAKSFWGTGQRTWPICAKRSDFWPEFWAGLLSISRDRIPCVDPIGDWKNAYTGLSYHGNGVAMGSYAEVRLADLVSGRQNGLGLPDIVRRTPRRSPFGKKRRGLSHLAYQTYQFMDRELQMSSAKSITVGVLETGRLPEELLPEFGHYPGMVASWLAPLQADFKTYAVLDGILPDSPSACDLWVITGSRHGVYEDHPWIAPLEGFVRDCRAAGSKMVGICFGHQLMAQALGGKVAKSEKEWLLGIKDYTPVNWPKALGQAPEKITIQAYHQDQIEQLPEGSNTIATSEFCPVAGLHYPGFAVSFQGHPEFSRSFASALLENRRGLSLSDTQVDAALSSQTKTANRECLAEMIAAHLADI